MRLNLLKVAVITMAVASVPLVTGAATVNARKLFDGAVKKKDSINWTNKATWSNKTTYKKLAKFKKNVSVLGTLTTNNLHVTGTTTFDTLIDRDMVELIDSNHTTVFTEGDFSEGFVKYKKIEGQGLQDLLDGNSNTLMTFNEGDYVLDIFLSTSSAETSGVLDIGTDANWANHSAEEEALVSDHSLVSAQVTRMTTADETNQSSLSKGIVAETSPAALTIQSTVDMTSSTTFVGQIIVTYLSLN